MLMKTIISLSLCGVAVAATLDEADSPKRLAHHKEVKAHSHGLSTGLIGAAAVSAVGAAAGLAATDAVHSVEYSSDSSNLADNICSLGFVGAAATCALSSNDADEATCNGEADASCIYVANATHRDLNCFANPADNIVGEPISDGSAINVPCEWFSNDQTLCEEATMELDAATTNTTTACIFDTSGITCLECLPIATTACTVFRSEAACEAAISEDDGSQKCEWHAEASTTVNGVTVTVSTGYCADISS